MEELEVSDPPPQYEFCVCVCHESNKSLQLYKELYAVYSFYIFCLMCSLFFDNKNFILVKVTSIFILNVMLGYILYWV